VSTAIESSQSPPIEPGPVSTQSISRIDKASIVDKPTGPAAKPRAETSSPAAKTPTINPPVSAPVATSAKPVAAATATPVNTALRLPADTRTTPIVLAATEPEIKTDSLPTQLAANTLPAPNDQALSSLEAAGQVPRRPKPGQVPAGFEALFEEQETLVDVYFADLFLTTVRARFTPDQITFLEPEAIITRIPDLLDRDAVLEQLRLQQSTNQEMRCYYKGQKNCGTLNAEIASVIFNPDSFRADIFVNPDLLAVSTLSRDKFLPPSSAEFSLLQNFNYAFSGTDGRLTDNSNLYSLTSLGYRQNSVKMVSNYTDNEYFNIQTLAYQRDWDAQRLQLGYFLTDNQGLRFAREYEIAGARFGTALDMREDLRQTSGNEIQVFLQSRGEVAIFKDNRLISSRIYDAGNQVLDTSDLPGGAYNVEIRINDSGGERTETQFYVKNNRLPPLDMPLYFVEVGELTVPKLKQALPNGVSEYLIRGGINKRISPSNVLVGGLSGTMNETMGEIGWFGIGRLYELSLNTAIATGSRYGFSTDFRVNLYRSWLVGNYRQIWGDEADIVEQVNLMGFVKEQATLNLNVPINESRLQFTARYIDAPGQAAVDTYSLGWDMPLLRSRNSNLRFNLQYTYDSGQNFVFATLRWRLGKDNWTFNVDPQYVHEDSLAGTDNYLRGTANANWDSRDMWRSNLRTNINATRDLHAHSLGANMDWAGNLGRMRVGAEHIEADAGSASVYNGNLATSFTVADGSFALGGENQNQSAVMVDVRGADSELSFDVLINGGRRGVVKAGKKSLITLRPFESYTVRLRPRGSSFVYFEDKEHTVTLYPGNVVKLAWDVDQVDIVFGRLVDQNNQAIANALLHGVAGLATTDESGIFQAEIKQGTKQIKVETRDSSCQLELPPYTARNGVASVGVLKCQTSKKP
jgi:hypothetical protein